VLCLQSFIVRGQGLMELTLKYL